MFNSRTLLLICIALSAGSLGLAFALSGNLPATLLALAIGLVWALPELSWTPPWAQKRLAGLAGDWLAEKNRNNNANGKFLQAIYHLPMLKVKARRIRDIWLPNGKEGYEFD